MNNNNNYNINKNSNNKNKKIITCHTTMLKINMTELIKNEISREVMSKEK